MPDTFRNPTVPAFYPDPSICRVEDDHYLVTPTFEYFPETLSIFVKKKPLSIRRAIIYPSAWQYVVKAIILVAAVYADVYFKKNR